METVGFAKKMRHWKNQKEFLQIKLRTELKPGEKVMIFEIDEEKKESYPSDYVILRNNDANDHEDDYENQF